MPYQHRPQYGRKPSRNHSPSNRRRGNQSRNHKKYIDPAKFVQVATGSIQEAYKPDNLFTDFLLNTKLQDNLAAKGYESPSPIQDKTIPAALEGKDIIGIAGTGTGKTASFALPILHKLEENHLNYALVIAPTRELAEQIQSEFVSLSRGINLSTSLLIGGTNMGNQLRSLKQNPRLVIGTPGRIKDHMRRRSVRLERFNIVVLDEVDRMLDMGFINDVKEILLNTNPRKQSMFYSATMDEKVRTLIDSFSSEPFTVSIKASSASENVHQDVVRYNTQTDKVEKLHDLLIGEQVSKVIVFDETQRGVKNLEQELTSRGFSTASIHGGKTQGQRKRALYSFKNNEVKILVATDVAARGIDVADISHVINYSIPNDYSDYIHRIGRAGRAGSTGHALTFIEQS